MKGVEERVRACKSVQEGKWMAKSIWLWVDGGGVTALVWQRSDKYIFIRNGQGLREV